MVALSRSLGHGTITFRLIGIPVRIGYLQQSFRYTSPAEVARASLRNSSYEDSPSAPDPRLARVRSRTAPTVTGELEEQTRTSRPARRKLDASQTLPIFPRGKTVHGKPRITVVGVGGAGGNAVDRMIGAQLRGVEFVVANTDVQSIAKSLAPVKVQLGKQLTKGLGSGARPLIGKQAAEEALQELLEVTKDSHMLFITTGLGGGTGTGAAPVIAAAAKESGILTVAVVSMPFRCEGPNRTRVAESGLAELKDVVDTLVVVPNQHLLSLCDSNTTLYEAFQASDAVLYEGIKGVTDLIVNPGLINLDFADIRTIMTDAGRAMMGSGEAEGPDRAVEAAKKALTNPLLGETSMESATGLLVTISGGEDLKLFEVDEIMEHIRLGVPEEANVIFGTTYDSTLNGKVRVSIIVSGVKIRPIFAQSPATPYVAKTEPVAEMETSKTDPDSTQQSKPGFFSRFFQL